MIRRTWSRLLRNLIEQSKTGRRRARNRRWKSAFSAEQLETRTLLTTFVVNSTIDAPDANPGDGVAQDANGNTTLRAAIMEANALGGADTIQLPAGTFTLTRRGIGENAAVNGDLDITDNVTIQGAGAGQTIIDAAEFGDRIFEVHDSGSLENPTTVSFVGMTFTGGRALGTTSQHPENRGGAMRFQFRTDVTIRDSRFTDNQAPATAGNSVYGLGGAIEGSGVLLIEDSRFDNNHSSNSGGALYLQGNFGSSEENRFVIRSTIRNTTFDGNSSNGGGAVTHHSPLLVESSTFANNNAAGQGGAIETQGSIFAQLDLVNSTVSNNQARFGGGVWMAGTIRTNTLRNIVSSTITNNRARLGGGLSAGSTSNARAENSIIAGNSFIPDSTSPSGPDVRGTVRSLGHNILGDRSGSFWTSAAGDQFNIDARLAPLADNGGPTLTHALLTNSPAIDAGQTTVTADQRGVRRPQGAADDIGAFELGSGAINRPPVSFDDQYSIAEDTTLNVGTPGILTNDNDPDGDPLTAVVVAGPSDGILTLNANGSFTYTPDSNFNGIDTFTYAANDGITNGNTATVRITVTPVNDRPVAINGRRLIDEDTLLSDQLVANDADGDTLTFTKTSDPANGFAFVQPDGSFRYFPNPNFHGTDSFTWSVSDGTLTDTATLTIIVNPVNDPAFAIDQTVNTDEDTPVNGQLQAVDVENDPITFALEDAAGYGTAVVNADGTFSYTPNADYFGTDTFTFRASDDKNAFTIGTVTVEVAAINDAPVAVDDSYSVNEDDTLTVNVGTVTSLHMDSEPGDFVGAGQTYDFTPANASFSASRNFDNGVSFDVDPPAAGEFWFLDFAAPFNAVITPGNYEDAMRFPFQPADKPGLDVSGNGRGSNTLTGRFVVREAEYETNGDVLRFAADFEQHSEGADPALFGRILFNSKVGAQGGVLANDTDVEDDLLTSAIVSGPSNGSLTLNRDGSLNYTPNPHFNGVDSFTYRANDGTADSNIATVNITVNPVNDPPTAADDSYTVDEDNTLTVPVAGVLGNDGDIDGDALTAVQVSGPSNGTLTLNADGSFTYTPDADFNGSDSFTYKANDGTADSNTATVTITVNPVNDPPVAVDDSYSVDEDNVLTVAAAGVLGNDSDEENDSLTAAVVDGPANGTLSFNPDGSFTYTPDADFNGSDSFTYKTNDGTADSNEATVRITVNAVNDAPVAIDDVFSVDEDNQLNVAALGLLANDSDVDGDSLAAALVSDPSNGTLVLNADGSFTYTPDANFNGSDSFTYRTSDGLLDSNVATVTINVDPVNDAPTLNGATFTIAENSPAGTSIGRMNGSDVEGDALTYSITAGNDAGAFAINPQTGQITVANSGPLDYETIPQFNLTVRVTDTGGLFADAAVTIRLTDVDETFSPPIDIRPGDDSNTINIKSRGKIEVAILSTADFDARTIDINTLTFGRTGDEDSLSRNPSNGRPRFKLVDVNGDGRLDVVVRFELEETGFQVGDTEGILRGSTLDGRLIEARQYVSIKKPGKKK